jgi:hypothetical protein
MTRTAQGSSASSNLLPLKEFLFNLFGFIFTCGDLRINLLLICEVIGKSRVHAGGRQMLILPDDVFSAVAKIMQDRYSVNADSRARNAWLAIPNIGRGC